MSNRYTIMRVKMKSYGPQLLKAMPKLESLGEPAPRTEMEIAELSPRELRQLRSDPDVVAVAPAIPIKLIAPFEVPLTAAATSAWGLAAVGATQSALDGQGATVAVLDTGIDALHPAFAGVSLQERDFTGDGNGDHDGHGTHCAGTIFGRDVGEMRIGIARGVKEALIGKVIGRDGGNSDWLFQALTWALREADVVSMSLGFDFPGYVAKLVADDYPVALATSQALVGYTANLRMLDAIMAMNRAFDTFGMGSSAVVVAASGNESQSPSYRIACSLPAAAEGIIAVGAAQQGPQGLSIAAFSNSMVDMVAPGVDVLSARSGGGLRSLSGTSMATPHVAGVAALYWQLLRNGAGGPATGRNVIARLLASAGSGPLATDVDLASRGNGLVAAPG